MDLQQDNNTKIKKLEQRIAELHKIYANDIHDSYKEGQQTQMMIDQYRQQLNRLKSQQGLSNDPNSSNKFLLINAEDNSITREFQLVENNPDPSKGLISKDSPLGLQLLNAKPSDKIQIGEEIFILSPASNRSN